MEREEVIPGWVDTAGKVLCGLRFSAFLIVQISSPARGDAQWQLVYMYLWVADLPITLLYWWLPTPIGEAIVGPAWWYVMPRVIWWITRKSGGMLRAIRAKSKHNDKGAGSN